MQNNRSLSRCLSFESANIIRLSVVFRRKKKVEEWSLRKRTVHTWILISSFVITITSPHNITLQEKLEFGQKTVEVADWSISWKTKIWYEMILIFYENAAPIYCLGERLISCWRNRRIGVCTQRQGPTSVVLEFTIIAHLYLKKYHNHCVFLKKRFLKDWIIYTQSL